jgi:hypothetical protein
VSAYRTSSAMSVDDKRHQSYVADSFAAWYKAEIERYVDRCSGLRDNDAIVITRNVSQFAMGRLVRELGAVGVTVSKVIDFLRKHATS